MWRQTGKQPALLAAAVELPEFGEDIWNHFLKLRIESGGARISSTLIKDYQWCEGVELELWQRKAIKRIDNIFHLPDLSDD